jgi:hypothetical protein
MSLRLRSHATAGREFGRRRGDCPSLTKRRRDAVVLSQRTGKAPNFTDAQTGTRFLYVVVIVGSLLTGCKPAPVAVERKEVRRIVHVTVSPTLRDRLRHSRQDMSGLRDHAEALTLLTHAVRSEPGYSVRRLSGQVFDFLVKNGLMVANCDIQFEFPQTAAGGDELPVTGSFRVVSVREAIPAFDTSWVAEAAWRAVPKEGRFAFKAPVGSRNDSSMNQIDGAVVAHVGELLAKDVEGELHKLLTSDGTLRFQSRGAAYGIGECALEACPREDGVDTLSVLRVAQRIRDRVHLPDFLAEIPEQDRDDIVAVARLVCGVMQPKEWKSVMRERLHARPVFVSKTTVVLELASDDRRLTVNRNAFRNESEQILARIEGLAVELVAKINAASLTAAGIDADDAKAGVLLFDAECAKCGYKGELERQNGQDCCPKCGAQQKIMLPEPL